MLEIKLIHTIIYSNEKFSGVHHLDEVEVVVGVDIEMLTQSQLSTLLQKLQLLLHSSSRDVTFKLISLYSLPRSGNLINK